ncbi:hypothetical protein BS78_K331700 [Paspalum vaginatum]|uniref:Uncharacterized protein n=1 Tax=Paspalum vaginatum TaxID=158149 RepID=A0A9W7XA16_9POAL|nr:hypothetical protein BS78_K331700 [Paspalum vaginatum]
MPFDFFGYVQQGQPPFQAPHLDLGAGHQMGHLGGGGLGQQQDNLAEDNLANLDVFLQQEEDMVQNDLAVGLVNEPNPMEEVINLDLNLPLAQPVEEIPAQVIIVPDEFAFDDGAPLLQLGQPQQQNPDLEVHIPQLVHPPVNYLVDADMLDQLIDLNAPEADQEQLFVNRMQRPNDVTVDPGLADYLARKQPSSLDLYFNQFDSYCPKADRFWKDFLAPSARCDKVDDGLLEDVHLLKKGKAAAPVGRTQTRKKKPQDSNEGPTSGGLGKEQ